MTPQPDPEPSDLSPSDMTPGIRRTASSGDPDVKGFLHAADPWRRGTHSHAKLQPTMNPNVSLNAMNTWSPDLRSSVGGLRLAALKECLLRQHLADRPEPRVERLLRLAAGEAEALAWQSPVPLLLMPILLEEKLERVRRYVATQSDVLERFGPSPPSVPAASDPLKLETTRSAEAFLVSE